MVSGQKATIDGRRRWAENNPEYVKASRKASDQKWRAKNRPKINKRDRDNRNGEELLQEIRKKHHKDMKNDPESLSCDFMDIILELGNNDYEALLEMDKSDENE